jgi:hypothetical protein
MFTQRFKLLCFTGLAVLALATITGCDSPSLTESEVISVVTNKLSDVEIDLVDTEFGIFPYVYARDMGWIPEGDFEILSASCLSQITNAGLHPSVWTGEYVGDASWLVSIHSFAQFNRSKYPVPTPTPNAVDIAQNRVDRAFLPRLRASVSFDKAENLVNQTQGVISFWSSAQVSTRQERERNLAGLQSTLVEAELALAKAREELALAENELDDARIEREKIKATTGLNETPKEDLSKEVDAAWEQGPPFPEWVATSTDKWMVSENTQLASWVSEPVTGCNF